MAGIIQIQPKIICLSLLARMLRALFAYVAGLLDQERVTAGTKLLLARHFFFELRADRLTAVTVSIGNGPIRTWVAEMIVQALLLA